MEDLLTLFTGPSTSSSDVAVSESSLEFLDEIDGLEPMPITIASSTVLPSSTKGRAKKKKKKRERDASKSSLEETKTENNNKKLKYDPLLPPNLKDLPSEEKKRLRLLRNRRSAQAHRDRKKIYVANLEKKVKELEEENTELKMLVDNLREENERLRSSSPLEDGDLFREIATFGEEEEDEKDYIHAEEQTYSSDSDHQVSPPQSPGPTSFVAFAFVFCFLLFGGSMVNDLVVRSPSSSSARLLTSSSHHHLLHNRALMSVVSSSSTPTPSDNDDDDVFQVQDLIQDHEEDIINNNDNKEQDKDAKLKWALERYISKYVELVRISKQMNENKAIALWKPDQDKEMQAVKDILRSNGIPLVFGGEGTTTQDNGPLISFSSEETLPSTSVVLCPRAHGFIQEPKTKRLRSSFFIEGQNLTLVVPGEDLHFGSWGKTRDSNALYEIGCKMQSVRPVSSAKISME